MADSEVDERRLTVIVGAGASFDCGMVSDLDLQWRPPLVKELFENRAPSFTNVLHAYRGAENLANEIRSAVAREGTLEGILRTLLDSPNLGTQRDCRQVPLYLQHLIGEVSTRFIRSGGTAFNTLVRNIDASDYTKVLYLTTNYDLFLEQALAAHHRTPLASLDDYVNSKNKWLLVKLHGSVLWSRRLLNVEIGPKSSIQILEELVTGEMRFDPIQLQTGYSDNHRFQDRQDGRGVGFYYPALALPAEAKDDFICPDDHAQAAKDFLGSCSDFLVLGFSGLDTHVLKLLKDVSCVNKFLVVNKDRKDAEKTAELIAQQNARFITNDRNAYDSSFSVFMERGTLPLFLAEQDAALA